MKRLQYRIASATEFTSKNPILARDEIGIERDTGKEKIGDGTTKWSLLSYFADTATDPTKVLKTGDTMTGDLSMGGTKKVTNLATGTVAGDAVNKGQLDLKVDKVTSTDNAVARFDGTTGALQGSGAVLDDSNNLQNLGPTVAMSGGSSNTYIYQDGDAGTYRGLRMRTGTASRWVVAANTDTESGSDAGSNFHIIRYTDAGSSNTALLINRATGRVRIGAVGATAGLEFGASGPRMMMGTGGPSGISAPVGSTWRQTDANSTYGSLTGLLWNKVDTGTAEGTDWLVDFEGRWIDWTPTLTNITRGTGYSQRNRYTRSGKSLTFDFALNFGTSGSVTGGATMTLPVAPANTYEKLFPAMFRTSSQYSAGSLYHSGSTTTASFYIWGTSGTYLGNLAYVSAMPGSWDATGRLSVSGTYEIA